jgi:2-polyprenyl-3-methyl-5-hydroxy-6-metoxy-1,4-benzoquinol methylase
MGEYDAECVKQAKLENKLNGINVLVGDQANYTDLTRWVKESGGNFDVIIDDGGHHLDMIWHSFQLLWPTVKPGGFYFIEDIEHGHKTNKDCIIDANAIPFSFVIQHWINMLHSGIILFIRINFIYIFIIISFMISFIINLIFNLFYS